MCADRAIRSSRIHGRQTEEVGNSLGSILRVSASIFAAGVLSACASGSNGNEQSLVAPRAANDALRDICRADDGELWGVSLCGPLLIVEPELRTVWASEPVAEGALEKASGGWIGVLPDGVPVANTSVEWAGQRWIMVLSPLPHDREKLQVLISHEAWHRIQASIGYPALASNAKHLDQERGRLFLRLEMRALRRALASSGIERANAAKDAILFRTMRFAEYPNAANEEIALDRNEGLASYTGVRLGVGSRATEYAARLLDEYDAHEAFTRAYAYATGPAYGLLLDAIRPDWRRNLGEQAPADLLTQAYPVSVEESGLAGIMAQYGGEQLALEERARTQSRIARLTELKRAYAEDARVILPLAQMQMEFDPSRVTPIEDLGSVYETLTVRDAWGEFKSSQGAMISEDFTKLIALEPASDGMSGPGWKLRLNEGYRLTPPDESGVRRLMLSSQN